MKSCVKKKYEKLFIFYFKKYEKLKLVNDVIRFHIFGGVICLLNLLGYYWVATIIISSNENSHVSQK